MSNVIDLVTGEPVTSNIIFKAEPEEHWQDKRYHFEAVCGEEGIGVSLWMVESAVQQNGLSRIFMDHWITAAEAERLGNALIDAVRSGRVTDDED